MRFVILEISWTGFSISYYSGMLVLMMTDMLQASGFDSLDDQQLNYEKAMLAMVVLGAGEMLGGQLVSIAINKLNSKLACLLLVVLIFLMSSSTISFLVLYQFNFLAYVTCFLWGLQDSAVNTHLMQMLGFEFEEEENAFACLSCVQGIACFFIQLIQSRIDKRQGFLWYSAIVCVIGLLSNFATYFFDFKE